MNRRLNLLEKLIQAFRAITMELDPFEGYYSKEITTYTYFTDSAYTNILHSSLHTLMIFFIATNSIIKQTCKILNAERATLFKLVRQAWMIQISRRPTSIYIYVYIGPSPASLESVCGRRRGWNQRSHRQRHCGCCRIHGKTREYRECLCWPTFWFDLWHANRVPYQIDSVCSRGTTPINESCDYDIVNIYLYIYAWHTIDFLGVGIFSFACSLDNPTWAKEAWDRVIRWCVAVCFCRTLQYNVWVASSSPFSLLGAGIVPLFHAVFFVVVVWNMNFEVLWRDLLQRRSLSKTQFSLVCVLSNEKTQSSCIATQRFYFLYIYIYI